MPFQTICFFMDTGIDNDLKNEVIEYTEGIYYLKFIKV